jgi:Cu(I)/Ag(I) efflux system membrane fusion protein
MIMKNYIIAGLLALITISAGCSNPDQKKNVPADEKKHKIAKQYTCTMHPEVLKDKPGLCPKCGMELVEKDK